MNSIILIKILRENVIEENLQLYKNLLDTTTSASDPVWKGILPIYKGLKEEEKITFLKFLRIVEANTLSHILGILDGTSSTNEVPENFILTTEGSDEKINGDLQDIFLELEEG